MKIYNNIPNIITISGLIIVNYSLLMYYLTNNSIYIIFMVIGFICDYLDGYFSRKLNLKSDIGNILDKVVDKINQTMSLILLIKKFKISKLYLLFYFTREIIMFILRKRNIKPKFSSIHGKIKTFIFPLILIFFHKKYSINKFYLKCWSIYNFITLFL